jgi:hypothetical protein
MGVSVGNIVTDLLFTLGPLYYLRKVKVSRYNQWALRGVFCIGLLQVNDVFSQLLLIAYKGHRLRYCKSDRVTRPAQDTRPDL